MRLLAILGSILVGAFTAASAQTSVHHGDVAVTYEWVHSNTQPGDCGCFGLNGGGISGSWAVSQRWSGAAEISGGYEENGPSTGNTLTLVSYLVGPRYAIRPSWTHGLQPFAQVLAGAAHAGGGIAGAGDGTYAFAARAGGGLDLPIGSRWAIRLVQVDYYLTDFANASNNHQNNLLLGSGVALRWSR